MRIKTKEVREVTRILDEIIEYYKETNNEKKRDYKTYEQRFAQRVKKAMKELSPLVSYIQ